MKPKHYAPLLHKAFAARGDCFALTLHPHFEDAFGLAKQRACFFEHGKRLCGQLARTFCGASRRAAPDDWLDKLPELFLIPEWRGRVGGDTGYHAHGLVIFKPEHGENPGPRLRALLRRSWGVDAQPHEEAFDEDLIERRPVPSMDKPRRSDVADRLHMPSFDLQPARSEGWLRYGLKNVDDDYDFLTAGAFFGR